MSTPELNDKFLICIDCHQEFVFPVSAQEFFIEKGYTDDPKRCKSCHHRHKKEQRQKEVHSSDAHLQA